MAQLEDMRLPAGAREALVNDPNFLRQLVEAALNRFLDTEITEHLQAGPYERSDACTGYRNGYLSRSGWRRPWRTAWRASRSPRRTGGASAAPTAWNASTRSSSAARGRGGRGGQEHGGTVPTDRWRNESTEVKGLDCNPVVVQLTRICPRLELIRRHQRNGLHALLMNRTGFGGGSHLAGVEVGHAALVCPRRTGAGGADVREAPRRSSPRASARTIPHTCHWPAGARAQAAGPTAARDDSSWTPSL